MPAPSQHLHLHAARTPAHARANDTQAAVRLALCAQRGDTCGSLCTHARMRMTRWVYWCIPPHRRACQASLGRAARPAALAAAATGRPRAHHSSRSFQQLLRTCSYAAPPQRTAAATRSDTAATRWLGHITEGCRGKSAARACTARMRGASAAATVSGSSASALKKRRAAGDAPSSSSPVSTRPGLRLCTPMDVRPATPRAGLAWLPRSRVVHPSIPYTLP